MSIATAFKGQSCPPTILAPLEEWDDATDAIISLIQTRYPEYLKHSCELTLGILPPVRRCGGHNAGYENVEDQYITLKSFLNNRRITLQFELDILTVGKEDEEIEVFSILLSDNPPPSYRKRKIAHYLIKGENRDEFEIIKEKIFFVGAIGEGI